MDETENYKNIIEIYSSIKKLDGTYNKININLNKNNSPRAVAFFDIDETLAQLRNIHGISIKKLFKELFDKEFADIEEVYFNGFKLGNSFREFDRMNGIYNLGKEEWKNINFYIKDRLNYKKNKIDNEGNEEHDIAKLYLENYGRIASVVAKEYFENNTGEFELVKIKPVFALAKLYKSLGIPMFAMTANAKPFIDSISAYLNFNDIFIDIATDEDMVGGGKEIIIPKMIQKLEENNIEIDQERIVIVGDSLSGDIGSGLRYKFKNKEVYIKGILVLKNNQEYKKTIKEINNNKELKDIIEKTDTEAFILSNVKTNDKGEPLLFLNKNNYLIKL